MSVFGHLVTLFEQFYVLLKCYNSLNIRILYSDGTCFVIVDKYY